MISEVSYMESKQSLLEAIGKPFAYDILIALKEPKRFKELEKACPIEKTRSKRIKELFNIGLIEHHLETKNSKGIILYRLTKKGERIINILEGL